ncbi:MAG: tetratricopeptide repeat protein [Alphaproteobacteria bacterium]|nr:tetratricopeptide repeat protein [Alphaproteobacteria bacterium]
MTEQPTIHDDRLTRCKNAIAAGDFDHADHLARAVAAMDPVSMDAYNLVGNVAIRSGKAEKAARWFMLATRLDHQKSIPPRLNHAMALEMAGSRTKAHVAYGTLHDEFPNDGKIRDKYVRSLFDHGEFSECLEILARLDNFQFDHYYMRGRCRLELGQAAKSVADFREALNLRPAYPEALVGLGQGLAHIGRHDEALSILEPMQAQKPEDSDLNYTLGRIYFDRGDLERSRDFLTAALPGGKNQFHASRHLGIIYRRLGSDQDAVPHLMTAIKLKPNDFMSFDNLGEALSALGRLEDLKSMVVSVLDQDPDSPSVWNGASIFLKTAEEPALGIDYMKIAARKYPDQPIILFNLAHMMNETTLAEEAFPYARRALLLKPDYAKAWNALCVCHCMPFQHDDARVAVDRAILIEPTLSSAWLNVGVLERAASRYTPAIAAMRHAIRLNPEDFTAQTNLAYALLMAGEIDQGFRQYDERWHNPGFPSSRRPFPLRIWEGENLPHHGLLIYMEQGMGDEIMFAWYMRYVARKAKHVMVECDYRLVDLFKRSFPYFEIVARRTPVAPITFGGIRKYKTPAGHIPKHFWFETREHMNNMWPVATRPIARTSGYLTVDPDRLDHWRRYLDGFGTDRLRVGVCWRSSVHNRARDLQYLTPEEIGACFDENFVLINMQYDHLKEETDALEQVGQERGYEFVTPPEIDLKDDLDDLTALCQACDIVVTPLISTAFMAGAVGTPAWVFRSSDTGRIWQQLGAPFVPWFPSMRMFFRYPTEPWSDTIERMREALREVTRMDRSEYQTVIDVEPAIGPPDWC